MGIASMALKVVKGSFFQITMTIDYIPEINKMSKNKQKKKMVLITVNGPI